MFEGAECADRVRGLEGNLSGAWVAVDAGKEYTCAGWRRAREHGRSLDARAQPKQREQHAGGPKPDLGRLEPCKGAIKRQAGWGRSVEEGVYIAGPRDHRRGCGLSKS